MLDPFTHRERNILIIFLIALIMLIYALGTSRITQDSLEAWSIPAMLFFVLPIGIYLITDKERIERINGVRD